MKKALNLILSMAMILSVAALASCGAEPPKEEPTEPLAQTAQSNPPAASTPEQEPAQKTTPASKPEPEPEPQPEPEPEEAQPAEPVLFTEVNETVYATGTVNLRSGPGTNYDKVGNLARGNSAARTGVGIDGTEAAGWSRVALADGTTVCVSSEYLSTSKPAAPASKPAAKQETPAESDGGSGDGTDSTGSGGSSDAADEAASLWGDWNPDVSLSEEEIGELHTDGWDSSRYR